ncbi:adhesion G-protein coupled receptor G4 [Trichonephila clavipes]|nr:adhesion G-protein coupled receptor G4 [Trichonephila clavipes]
MGPPMRRREGEKWTAPDVLKGWKNRERKKENEKKKEKELEKDKGWWFLGSGEENPRVLLGDADEESETRMSKNALRTGRRQAVDFVTEFLTNHGPFVSNLHHFKLKTPNCLWGSLGDADHYVFACSLTKDFHLVSPSQNTKKALFQSIIIAVAISQGETKLRQLTITVTDFNIHPPVFEHDVYRGELHVRSKVGVTVLRVRALDEDPVPYNAEVYYKLDDPKDPRGRFNMDPQTGVLTLARSLEVSPSEPIVELGVTAVDGGSPKRSDYARIEVLIKTISGNY